MGASAFLYGEGETNGGVCSRPLLSVNGLHYKMLSTGKALSIYMYKYIPYSLPSVLSCLVYMYIHVHVQYMSSCGNIIISFGNTSRTMYMYTCVCTMYYVCVCMYIHVHVHAATSTGFVNTHIREVSSFGLRLRSMLMYMYCTCSIYGCLSRDVKIT